LALWGLPRTQPKRAMPYKPVPKDCFIQELERYFYKGRHLGVMDCNRKLIGSAVKGRRIDV
jgi:hypothetical protein